MSEMGAVRVEVSPGSGRLARRAGALLFDPTGTNEQLVDAFDQAASDAAAVTAVQRLLMAAKFDRPPVAMVYWSAGSDVTLLTFGDLALTTSAPSAPSLSGASSTTWVTHQLVDWTPPVEIRAGDAAATGDLRLGVAQAGGFALHLVDARAPQSSPAPPPAPSEAAGPVPRVIADDLVSDAHWSETMDFPPEVARNGDAAPEPEPAAETVVPTDPSTPALVEAVRCASGHPNPTLTTRCRECGNMLPVDSPSELISQPALGRLVFDDGVVTNLDRPLVVGRRVTDAADDRQAVLIDRGDVSREHLAVSIEGWDVLVTDLGSRNGTYVLAPTNPSPVQIEANVSHLLEPGSTVHLGSADVFFTYHPGR